MGQITELSVVPSQPGNGPTDKATPFGVIPGELQAREGDPHCRESCGWIPFPALWAAGDDTNGITAITSPSTPAARAG